ncbi:MAG: NfeD family protein [Anaerolineae bacterium]|nr:NfeD family protein [Anaerolineae bacterium]
MKDRIRVVAGFFIRILYAPLFLKKQDWSARLVFRYALLQIPGLALLVLILIVIQQWVELPAWFTWGLVIIWVVKEAALFPLLWRAYDWDHAGDANSMVGLRGVVQKRLSPTGSVRVRGELWQARVMGDGPPIYEGEVIQVREIRGLTLFVEPNHDIGDGGGADKPSG